MSLVTRIYFLTQRLERAVRSAGRLAIHSAKCAGQTNELSWPDCCSIQLILYICALCTDLLQCVVRTCVLDGVVGASKLLMMYNCCGV